MRKRTQFIILISSILIFLVQASFAQPPQRFEERKRVRERIETLRLWKMIEFLDLTPEQSDEFLPLLHKFQKAQKDLEKAKVEIFKDLKNELGSEEVNEKKIQEILVRLEKNREELERERKSFLIDSRKTLTLIQEAKLILFEQRFERELKETLRKLRLKRRLERFEEG